MPELRSDPTGPLDEPVGSIARAAASDGNRFDVSALRNGHTAQSLNWTNSILALRNARQALAAATASYLDANPTMSKVQVKCDYSTGRSEEFHLRHVPSTAGAGGWTEVSESTGFRRKSAVGVCFLLSPSYFSCPPCGSVDYGRSNLRAAMIEGCLDRTDHVCRSAAPNSFSGGRGHADIWRGRR